MEFRFLIMFFVLEMIITAIVVVALAFAWFWLRGRMGFSAQWRKMDILYTCRSAQL